METFYYTSKDGVKVEVSREHIDTAIRLKKELQQASPSFVCSWKMHKSLMMQEGYDDSENSERYRLFIKNHQSSSGQLGPREVYEIKVADSKLESIKNAVGDLSHTKREIQTESKKLNKLKRSLSDTAITSEAIRDAFVNDINWNTPSHLFEEKIKGDSESELIVVLSDWHIGAVIENSNGNSYNLEIAKRRLDKLFNETLKYVRKFGITDITVANCGDFIEGLYMRSFNQAFEAEFNLSEQISKSTKLLLDFIVALSVHCNVKYFGIAGNHDRWFFDKNTVDSDNAMKIINESIKTYIELSGNVTRIEYLEVEEGFNYEKIIEIKGNVFKFLHGDFEGKNMDLLKHISINQEDIDCLVMGHYHNHQVLEGNYGKLSVMNGSLMGRNSYSRKFKAGTNASQTLILVDENSILPLRIDLQLN